MKNKIIYTSLIIRSLFLIVFVSNGFAQQVRYGVRTGINDNHEKDLDLSVYEIYLHIAPPIYSIADTIFDLLNIYFETALGVVHDKKNCSLLFSMGPTLELINYENIVSVSAGLKPSLITNHIFKDFDLGGTFIFKSHIALTILLYKQIN